MSIHVVTRVYEHKIGDHIAKAVLAKIADNANDAGIAWPSIRYLSETTEIPERTIKRKIAWLVEVGWLIVRKNRTEGGKWGHNVYEVCVPGLPGATVAHGAELPGATTRAVARGSVFPQESSNPPVNPPKLSVSGIPVKAHELVLAQRVLSAWNELAGQSFTSQEWLRRIVARIREHPDLLLEDHERVIGSALADPWWDGAASPRVVYGNGAIFEQMLMQAKGEGGPRKVTRRFGIGVTADTMLAKARETKRLEDLDEALRGANGANATRRGLPSGDD